MRVPAVAVHVTDAEIALRQRLLECRPLPRTWGEYMRCARWWELEAMRAYASSPSSMRTARVMRWAAELAREFGPATWRELLERAGHPEPPP